MHDTMRIRKIYTAYRRKQRISLRVVKWLSLKEPLATLWRGKDAFEEVKNLQGEVISRTGKLDVLYDLN